MVGGGGDAAEVSVFESVAVAVFTYGWRPAATSANKGKRLELEHEKPRHSADPMGSPSCGGASVGAGLEGSGEVVVQVEGRL